MKRELFFEIQNKLFIVKDEIASIIYKEFKNTLLLQIF